MKNEPMVIYIGRIKLSIFQSFTPEIAKMDPIMKSIHAVGLSWSGLLFTNRIVGTSAQISAKIAKSVGRIPGLFFVNNHVAIAEDAIRIAAFSILLIGSVEPFKKVRIKTTVGLNARIKANITVILSEFGFAQVVNHNVIPTTDHIAQVTRFGTITPRIIPKI
jgi:hypothetical protein